MYRDRGDGVDFCLTSFSGPVVPPSSLVLDLANRYAREPGRVVVSGGQRVPLGRLSERYRGTPRRNCHGTPPSPHRANSLRAIPAQAAYGRDDLLGCKRSFYAAANQHCGFLAVWKSKSALGYQPPRHRADVVVMGTTSRRWRGNSAASIIPRSCGISSRRWRRALEV